VEKMAIKECNYKELKERMQENPNAIFYRVCRFTFFEKGVKNAGACKNNINKLALNKELHDAYHANKITWAEYVPAYTAQIENDPKAQALLLKIKKESETRDVYLVCVCEREKGTHCHRFLLIDMIKEI
jgi:uncharacterized protein YeaO (DUF488 family)